jgi:CBS domain-containing protein
MNIKKALDMIDILVPVLVKDLETWDLILRLGRIRRSCATYNKTISGRVVKMITIKDLAKEIFIASEEGSVLTEMGRIDSILRQPTSYIAKEYPSLDPETDVNTLIEIFHNLSLECIVLSREDLVIGVVSENSLIESLENIFPIDAPVIEIATREIDYVDQDASIAEVIGLMIQRGFRRMPIKDSEGKIIGITTMLDIINELAEIFSRNRELTSIDILTRPISQARNIRRPLFIDPETSIREASKKILEDNTGCAILGTEKDPKGLVTERDLIKTLRKLIYQTTD